jgi:DegV family protein with EDD domain
MEMYMDYEIVTDSSCNLSDQMIRDFGLHILPLTFMSDGEQYQSYTAGRDSDLKSFFKMMREGKVFTTSLPNLQNTETLLKELLDAGKNILYIGFSSGLSGTYQATAALLEELRKTL